MEMQLHCSFVLPSHPTLYQVYQDSGREVLFNNINIYESNVVQLFNLIFCDSER